MLPVREDVLTAHSVERGPVQIVAETPADGATPAEAPAMTAGTAGDCQCGRDDLSAD